MRLGALTAAGPNSSTAARGTAAPRHSASPTCGRTSACRPTSATTTVRVESGRTQVLDGPYAEVKEQLGGFLLIDVADLDAAIAWAARCPAARHGTIEVRPLWPPDAA
ncbi:YciI family protein [bacterium]|nr:YciI family protein [bacterium]